MTIAQYGEINTTALAVPDLLIQVVPPTSNLINGVPSNVLGVVGTASWGPLNSPAIVGGYADYAAKFGHAQAVKYDMGTAVMAAAVNGANNFRCVRVSNGNDAAASVAVQTTGVTLTAFYTGSLGNKIKVTFSKGSVKNSTRVTISVPGQPPEIFDNITGAANARWVNIAAAINNGQSVTRGPSKWVTATAGALTAAVTEATVTLTGGADGGGGATDASDLVGSDTTPRTGMYALRATGCSLFMLADADDDTTWTTQVAFALSEGAYAIMTGPAGDTIADHLTALDTAGVDSYGGKLLFGDWVWFRDYVNDRTRLISPQPFAAGLLANLSPEQSGLNKQLHGVVGTQKSAANQVYSAAELQSLGLNGTDLIANPVPGGNYFGLRFGRNMSSNAAVHGDNYTRLVNYIATSLNAGMGQFIGKLQSPKLRREAAAVLSAFLQNMADAGMIGNAQGTTPYFVQIDDANNPPDRVALGYMQADVKVQFLGVVEYFIVNVEGGQSVTIERLPRAA